MGLLQRIFGRMNETDPVRAPGEQAQNTSETGRRPNPESQLQYIYRQLGTVDFDLRQTILDIRRMHKLDPRVKHIHQRTSRSIVKGGLQLDSPAANRQLHKAFDGFVRRLHLDRRAKLESDARGFMMEGNLAMQWVLDGDNRIMEAVRMPAETIVPNVSKNGRFPDVGNAYHQVDLLSGNVIARWALYQMTLERLDPDNYDDWGSMGRPYLDAARTVWRKLTMTEEDLVVRRHMRAPLRMSHVLEGASEPELAEYRDQVEQDQAQGNTRDYYLNKKGAVTPIQGDGNLDQIADVAHLLDTFFAGAPAPKALFGYPGEVARDILEELKKDYFDELDALQDGIAFIYDFGFKLDLLFRGMNPSSMDFSVIFAERKTDTANQRADLALKLQALGLPRPSVWRAAGVNVRKAETEAEDEARRRDPYPDPENVGRGQPRVSVTPGNARSGESATTISTRS